jgi:hypothetical protein
MDDGAVPDQRVEPRVAGQDFERRARRGIAVEHDADIFSKARKHPAIMPFSYRFTRLFPRARRRIAGRLAERNVGAPCPAQCRLASPPATSARRAGASQQDQSNAMAATISAATASAKNSA